MSDSPVDGAGVGVWPGPCPILRCGRVHLAGLDFSRARQNRAKTRPGLLARRTTFVGGLSAHAPARGQPRPRGGPTSPQPARTGPTSAPTGPNRGPNRLEPAQLPPSPGPTGAPTGSNRAQLPPSPGSTGGPTAPNSTQTCPNSDAIRRISSNSLSVRPTGCV